MLLLELTPHCQESRTSIEVKLTTHTPDTLLFRVGVDMFAVKHSYLLSSTFDLFPKYYPSSSQLKLYSNFTTPYCFIIMGYRSQCVLVASVSSSKYMLVAL